MAGTNQELARQGGRHNLDLGTRVSATDMDRMGDMQLQTLMHWMMLLFYDEANNRPMSGVVGRELLSYDHLEVTATADLDFSVAPGFGMVFDAASLGGDEFGHEAYRPIVLSSAFAGSLAAHDGSNPRIDLVVAQAAWITDQSASRNVKNPATGVVSSSSIDQRRRFGATISVVTGTAAANPTAPATPTGAIVLATCRVPASSGAAAFDDARPVLEIGPLFKSPPIRQCCADFVPDGGPSELNVLQNGYGASMHVQVFRGRAVINGVMRHYAATDPVAIATADAALDRIDRVVADEDGTIKVVTGTPSISPSAPAVAANQLPIAQVAVGAAVTSIVTANITDERERRPFDGGLLQSSIIVERHIADGAIEDRHIASASRTITVPCGSMVLNVTSAGGVGRSFGARFALDDATAIGSGLAQVQLPDGATVTAVRLLGTSRTAGGGSAQLLLKRVADDGTVVDMADVTDASLPSGSWSISDATISNAVIDNGAYSYVLMAEIDNASVATNEVELRRIEVDITTAQHLS